ncbi:MAG: MATE family efflux transporter [Luteolibacter sp.]|jgi:MATE family multidrug resistance protein|nr:MATE family efflux transporter [Luteolibacter sp.]
MRLWHESRLTLRLALPLMIGQLSQMLLGVADTVMIGRLGVTELAALTFASSLFHVPFVFGIGVLTAVSVFTSNCRGANDAPGARGSCRHGLILASALGLFLFALSWLVSTHLDRFGQPPEVSGTTAVYFRILMASVVPALASIALKNHADALNRPWPPFWIFLGGVALNIGLNWVMIYGKLGCPALGFEGAAWATLISRTAILLAMFVWLGHAKGLREWVPQRWWRKPHFSEIRGLLAIGFPASAQMLFEVSAFSLAGLIMGRFGPESMAAHQIAITLAATAFMIPLGLSMALTVRCGEAQGAGATERLRPIAISGWLLVTGYALLGATSFLLFGEWMAAAFTRDAGVIRLSASLLLIVGVFQMVDGLQVASSAMLRGLHDARVPAVMGFVSYWLFGLPVAAGLAFWFDLGACGVWWGLAAGLFVACVTLGPRLWNRSACSKPPA